jgi:signal transduction histidine kinase
MRDDLREAILSAQRLSRLVIRLFDVAQARSGTLQLRMAPCDLVAIVREQIAIIRASAARRVIQDNLIDRAEIPIQADADRIGQAVLNYLTNAVKYSAEAAPVEVCLSLKETVARVTVRDYGVGIPLADQARIWEPFYQVPGSAIQEHIADSLGLGLHICKTIIERHGGQVGVESAEGQGATFWFTLPLADFTPGGGRDGGHPA